MIAYLSIYTSTLCTSLYTILMKIIKSKNRHLFVRNVCKCVLNESKSLFAERMKQCIASCKFGSKDYWCLCKSVLNNRKPTIPPLFNQSADKAECFAWKFSSNSMLNSSSVPTVDFSPRTEALLSDLHITSLWYGHRL